ncbi:MAG TPA: type II toxin-antitoxin system prevent-host-death family antitoxin, partial [Promineifilum sp.]|nr:type II toxin-antitoxin system prevent-host-death family antitoxin [Promineifilum sp.]HQF71615.1 type II toxin-antitoxin system prevent-host-death family antitoxin [Promineifilum sp.]
MEERQIGTTELRQRLTDVIQAVKEEKVAYVVETFGRPQVVIVDANEYQSLKTYHAMRQSFFERLLVTGEANAKINADLTEEQLLALIDAARDEVYDEG